MPDNILERHNLAQINALNQRGGHMLSVVGREGTVPEWGLSPSGRVQSTQGQSPPVLSRTEAGR